MTTVLEHLRQEFEAEVETTRKFLSIVPQDKFEWRPHPKSMDLRTLAVHVAELPTWLPLAVHTDELDFMKEGYNPVKLETTKELVEYFEKNVEQGREALAKADPDQFDKQWLLRSGETIHVDTTKYGMMRVAMSQTIHHRAQLGVFLRLLDVPIPGSYGPSADEQNFS
ncbi:MAG: DinB family protein [Chitinophagaceae bacterium]|nr:MAG: DinB family protein [Chitinophagaceae bacterium]